MPSLLQRRAKDTRYYGKGGALQEAVQDKRVNSKDLGSSEPSPGPSQEAERPGTNDAGFYINLEAGWS